MLSMVLSTLRWPDRSCEIGDNWQLAVLKIIVKFITLKGYFKCKLTTCKLSCLLVNSLSRSWRYIIIDHMSVQVLIPRIYPCARQCMRGHVSNYGKLSKS